ncbi:oxidoreductase [Rhizodiscina lignyota]|uniref:Oxidoreductase n=1 Tax=Rhizodiscina lignyota TaxID=1504668 RepID=A0A9P4I4Y7_9PEZI|nr:oxidoreductase [Rhizodiscina lignyota]
MASLLKGVGYITGAGSGIGQFTALAFARHGARALTITDISPSNLSRTVELLKQQSPNVELLPIEMDVADEASVDDSVAQTVKQFGRLDMAVNNAGLGGAPKMTVDQTKEDWQRVVDINLTGVWLCQRAQVRQMMGQSYDEADPRSVRGSIVNVASMLGLVGVSKNTPAGAYGPTKHGVMGLTKSDAIAYAAERIRINAMCPGYVETPLLLEAMKGPAMSGEMEKVPMGRLAKMDEIADAMVFLSSPMASFMTGTGLVVDGGYTAG